MAVSSPARGWGGSNWVTRSALSTWAAWALPRLTHNLRCCPQSTSTQRTFSSARQAQGEESELPAARSLFSSPVQQKSQRRHKNVRPHPCLGAVVHGPYLQQTLQVGEATLHLTQLLVGFYGLHGGQVGGSAA